HLRYKYPVALMQRERNLNVVKKRNTNLGGKHETVELSCIEEISDDEHGSLADPGLKQVLQPGSSKRDREEDAPYFGVVLDAEKKKSILMSSMNLVPPNVYLL
ncbi:hypothetical protein HAX54_029275, partial [Datura stramonium]|nr:hypothetical protein [Datura stramonium]